MNNAIAKWLQICADEVGYLEKASNSNLYSKTANAGYNNYTKYWADLLPSYQKQPWCAAAVSWTLDKAVGRELAKKLLKHWVYVYCPTLAELNQGQLKSNPDVGDIILFKRNGTFVHTGVVSFVKGDYFESYEGNTSSGHTIIPNGGGYFKKSYYNSDLPGTKFVQLDWSLCNSLSEDEISDTEEATLLKKIATLESLIEINKEEIYNIKSEMIYNYIDDNMPDFARPIIKALVEVGVLKGVNDKGELGLRYRDLRNIVMKYRAGAYDTVLGNKKSEIE